MYVHFFVTSLVLVFTLACRLRVVGLLVVFFPSLVIALLPFPLDEVGVPSMSAKLNWGFFFLASNMIVERSKTRVSYLFFITFSLNRLESTSNEEGEQGVLIATSSLASLVDMIWVNDEK
jgi:hypothetical protein